MKAITPIANTTMAIRIAHGGHRMALGASFDLSRVVVATSELGRGVRASVAWLPEVLAGNELTADTVESVSVGKCIRERQIGHKAADTLAAFAFGGIHSQVGVPEELVDGATGCGGGHCEPDARADRDRNAVDHDGCAE